MAVSSPFTAVHQSPNRSVRQNVARRGVVLHHAATTSLAALMSMTMGGKQVSATGNCKDDQLPLMVPNDNDRPWSLSSAYWDSAMRSIETANESTDGWTISDKSHWKLAHAVAFWAEKDGFYPHRNGPEETWTVLGHREIYSIHDASYATACPGGMDLDLVTKRAQTILATNGALPGMDDDDMAQGAWYKVRAGDPGAGNTFWQEKPNGPFIQVGGDTLRAFEANGNKVSEQSYAGIKAMLDKWGLIERPVELAVTVGEVKATFDYDVAANTFFDVQATRLKQPSV